VMAVGAAPRDVCFDVPSQRAHQNRIATAAFLASLVDQPLGVIAGEPGIHLESSVSVITGRQKLIRRRPLPDQPPHPGMFGLGYHEGRRPGDAPSYSPRAPRMAR
jgi:hypothetical protein